MLILTFCGLSACAPGAPPTPEGLGENYHARGMDRLTVAGDSVLEAEAGLRSWLDLDGDGRPEIVAEGSSRRGGRRRSPARC
ncbi:MAG TPA: hypothetical protein VMM12_09420 [Longimicrobiales bacterium]|nr:hypothetical protein [Longimicrobiales bacterium]